MKESKKNLISALVLAGTVFASSAMASTCADLPTAAELKAALMSVAKLDGGVSNGGVGAPEWLTEVDSSGIICAIVHNLPVGTDVTKHLAISHRILSAQKAGISNGFSRSNGTPGTGLAVSSANIFFGSQFNEVAQGLDSLVNSQLDPFVGNPKTWGTPKDPLVGNRVGGTAAIPGGLSLWDSTKTKVGAIGASGDFRCTDHVIAWKVRELLRNKAYSVANVPYGLSGARNDALVQDVDPDTRQSKSGYGYFVCANNPTPENDGGSIEHAGGASE
jgi:hypothetical protein